MVKVLDSKKVEKSGAVVKDMAVVELRMLMTLLTLLDNLVL